MRSLLPLVLPAGLLVLLFAAARSAVEPRADLVLANAADAFTLDPQRMSWLPDLRLGHALHEGLLRWEVDDFRPRPAVARDLPEVRGGGRTLVFRFDSEARWSNGDPVRPEDFRFAWMRALLPDTGADYAAFLLHLDGAAEFVRMRTEDLAGFAVEVRGTDAALQPAALDGLLRRLRDHLAEHDRGTLPAAIPVPAGDERGRVARTLDDLAARRARGERPGGADLLAVPALDRWLRALDAPAVRAAEAGRLLERAEARFAEEVGVVPGVADDGTRTLTVHLAGPVPYLLDLLCFPATFPVHRPTVEGWPAGHAGPEPPPVARRTRVEPDPATGRLQPRTDWQRPGTLVSNGPYVLERRRFRRDLRLVRNPRFRDPELARAAVIDLRVIEHGPTAVLALESGLVDWIADADAPFKAELVAQARAYRARHAQELAALLASGLDEDEALSRLPAPGPGERRDVHLRPAFAIEFMSFNCRPELPGGAPNPFADPRVRRAFTRAVDRAALAERVVRLGERPLSHLVPPDSIPGYASPEGLGFDPDAALRELAGAGWRDRDGDGRPEDAAGNAFPVVDLLYPTSAPRNGWIASALAGQWKRVLGVAVEPRGVEWRFMKDALRAGDYMIGRGRWYGDYGDPTTFLDISRTGDGNNDRGYSSPEYDALLDLAAETTDPERRFALLAEAEALLVQRDLPILVLSQLNAVVMYDPARVRGATSHPRQVHDYARLRAIGGRR